MLKMVRRFNQEHPDYRVLMQRMDWGTYYNKLFVAGLGNRAPEVFIVHAGNLERFMQADFIRTIDDLVNSENGIPTSDFSENIWEAVEKNGAHYGVPLDVHILGMYYNKKLFKEAGIVDENGEAKPPTTREEFLDATAKMTKDTDGDGNIDQWGYVFTWFYTNMFTFMKQWDGAFFSPELGTCVMNRKENVEALRFGADLVYKYKVSPSPENFDSWIGFRQGKVGIAFEGIYMLEDLKKQKDLDWGAAPLPLLGKKNAAWADSHVICLRKDLKGKKLEGAWEFAKYLSDNSLVWSAGGQVPVRHSLRNTELFKKMHAQTEFAKQIPYIQYIPKVPYTFEFTSELHVAAERALKGSISPEKALDEATENVNKTIRRHKEMKQKNRKK